MMTKRTISSPFILFKGCTRPPLILSVPIIPFMIMLMSVAGIAMLFSLWWWLLAVPFWLGMSQLIKVDDKAFRIFGLWVETRLHNYHKALWGAFTYAPTTYRRKR